MHKVVIFTGGVPAHGDIVDTDQPDFLIDQELRGFVGYVHVGLNEFIGIVDPGRVLGLKENALTGLDIIRL